MEQAGTSVVALFAARMEVATLALWAALLIGYFIGQFLPVFLLVEQAGKLAAYFGRKLNRHSRDVATRAWRGVVVLSFFLVPAMLVGLLLGRALPHWAEGLVVAMLFTSALRSHRIRALWQQARAKQLTLQAKGRKHLFKDTHGVLRFEILDHANHFAIGILGAWLWYLLGGLSLMFGYLALAFASTAYATEHEENRAFGGVARSLFAMLDAGPRLLAAGLLLVASLFVPGCKAMAAVKYWPQAGVKWHAFLAALLNISLGGPMPLARRTHHSEWVGEGSAQLTSADLTRWVLLWMVSLLMLGLTGLGWMIL